MKKHSEAGRINVGSVAMSECYARVELADRPVTNQSPLPSALIATPADGPPASGETNTMLERAFSVHVTGRPPIDVKGKGRLEMFWADPVVRPAVVSSPGPGPGYPAHGTPVLSQIRLSPEMQVRLGPAGEGPHVAGSPPLGTHARELGSIAGLNAVANESFRVRETQTRELGTRRTVLPVRRMTAVAEGTVAAAVGTPLLPARLPSSLASSAAATPAGICPYVQPPRKSCELREQPARLPLLLQLQPAARHRLGIAKGANTHSLRVMHTNGSARAPNLLHALVMHEKMHLFLI
jgi:hypothetical protein